MTERPSPQSITVCTLIALYSDPMSPLNEIPHFKTNDNDARTALGGVLEKAVTLGWKGDGSVISLNQWISRMQEQIVDQATCQQILGVLQDTLQRSVASIENLMELMASIQASVSEGIVDPVSAHGVYLRQVSLGFEELSFESVTILWRALREGLDEWNEHRLKQQQQQHSSTLGTYSPTESSSSPWSASREQIERMVREECLKLVSNMDGATSSSNRSAQISDSCNDTDGYEMVELKIQSFLDDDPELPLLYFWRYLNCLRHGEKAGAIDALHAYLDHAMMAQSDILQFSALLLANTHANFGDWHIAELAVEEAVKVAQQSKDASCVAFALGWLALLHRKTKKTSTDVAHDHDTITMEGEMLQRCAARAIQGNLRPLQSGASLLLAQYSLQNMSDQPSDANQFDEEASSTSAAWTNLLNAMATAPPAQGVNAGASGRTNNNAQAAAATDILPQTLDRPTALSEGYTGQNAMQDLAQQRMVSAGIWDSLGNPTLSGMSSITALECHSDLSMADAITSIQNVARNALHGSSSDKLGMSPKGNSTDKPCVYAVSIDTLLTLRRRYRKGRGIGENKAEEEKDDELEEPIYRSILLILHEWAVRRGELNDARALQIVMPDYLYPRMGAAYDSYALDIALQKVELLTKEGRWDDARAILRPLIDETSQTGPTKQRRTHLLLRMGVIQLESSSTGMAALKPLLETLALSKTDEMDATHCTALSMLARLFLKLGYARRALALLKSCLPLLMQHAHIYYQGEAMLTYAMCYMHLTNPKNQVWMEAMGERHQTPTARIMTKNRITALSYLRRATQLFEQCQDIWKLKRVHYLQACVYNDLGDSKTKERDSAADRFLVMSRYLERATGEKPGSDSPYILDNLEPVGLKVLMNRTVPRGLE